MRGWRQQARICRLSDAISSREKKKDFLGARARARAGSKPRLKLSRDTMLRFRSRSRRDSRNKEEVNPRNVISFRMRPTRDAVPFTAWFSYYNGAYTQLLCIQDKQLIKKIHKISIFIKTHPNNKFCCNSWDNIFHVTENKEIAEHFNFTSFLYITKLRKKVVFQLI